MTGLSRKDQTKIYLIEMYVPMSLKTAHINVCNRFRGRPYIIILYRHTHTEMDVEVRSASASLAV